MKKYNSVFHTKGELQRLCKVKDERIKTLERALFHMEDTIELDMTVKKAIEQAESDTCQESKIGY